DAQRAAHVGGAHVLEDRAQALAQLGEREVAVGIDVHGKSGPRAGARDASGRETNQIVCVGLDDDSEVPSTSSMRTLSMRVFSSNGKRTPTPCVRPPGALAGVIQPTLPATG